jgi:hypothetical protein
MNYFMLLITGWETRHSKLDSYARDDRLEPVLFDVMKFFEVSLSRDYHIKSTFK